MVVAETKMVVAETKMVVAETKMVVAQVCRWCIGASRLTGDRERGAGITTTGFIG